MGFHGKNVLFGKNVPSTFKSGGDYFTKEEIARMNSSEFGDRAREKLKGLARYSLDSMAAPRFLSKMLRDNQEASAFMENYGKIVNAPADAGVPYYAEHAAKGTIVPLLGYGFSGYVRSGNGGTKEKMYLARKKDEGIAAAARMRAERNVEAMAKGKKLDIKDVKDADRIMRIVKKNALKDIGNPMIRLYKEAKTPAQKKFVIERMKSTPEGRNLLGVKP